MANYDPENWWRFWQETKEDKTKTGQKGDEAAEDAHVKQIVGVADSVAEQLHRQTDEATPKNKSERRWKRAEVLGLWAAAGVGVIAVWVSNHDSATQLTTMNNQVGVMQRQLTAMEADQRAWIGPTDASFEVNPTENSPLKAVVSYGNTGRQPGPTDKVVLPKIFTEAEWTNGTAATAITSFKEQCLKFANVSPFADVVYPTTGSNFFQMHIDTGRTDISKDMQLTANKDLIDGGAIFALEGCFVYRTVETTRHTAFCFFHWMKQAIPGHLAHCTVGQGAD